jgi:acetate kinase
MQIILVLNAGSSTIKFAVFAIESDRLEKIYQGLVDTVLTTPHLRIKNGKNEIVGDKKIKITSGDHYQIAIEEILNWLKEHDLDLVATGHRVAHGGAKYLQAVQFDQQVLSYLESLTPLAPLHQPYNVMGYKVLKKKFPDLLQVACFDTSFHTTGNKLSQMFALPKKFLEKGIRRYGFHGLSYQYVVEQFDQFLPEAKREGKIIIAHLGNGTSMCAVDQRKSVATTLSFSALDGLPMGTRCGNLDPGVILYLMATEKMGHKELEHLLYKESGLYGVSGGISSDMRVLLKSESPDAKLALDLFIYKIGAWVGMLAAELGGLDGIVFTAGIGENSPYVRAKICEKAAWLGARIDPEKNKTGKGDIADSQSTLALCVIHTDEESMIAKRVREYLVRKAN